MHPPRLVELLRKDMVVPGQGKQARLSHEGSYERLSQGSHGWSPFGENDPGPHGAEERPQSINDYQQTCTYHWEGEGGGGGGEEEGEGGGGRGGGRGMTEVWSMRCTLTIIGLFNIPLISAQSKYSHMRSGKNDEVLTPGKNLRWLHCIQRQ